MTQRTHRMPSEALLRFGLSANAAFSTACALALLLAAPSLGPMLGMPAGVLRALGVGLVAFVALLALQLRRRPLHLGYALSTSLADFGWVAGSLLFVALWPGLTGAGGGLVLGVALGVAAAGAIQLAGLRRLVSETDPTLGTRHRFAIRRVVDAPPAAMWAVVSDLGAIHRYSPGLVESSLRGGAAPGVGAVRECADDKGQRWAERCVAFEPPRALELEFQADAEGFPFPVRRMIGGWSLAPAGGDATEVTVWWSFTTRPAWAGLVLTVLLSVPIGRDFPRLLDRMAAAARERGAAPVAPPGAATTDLGPSLQSSARRWSSASSISSSVT